jgi:tRNA 2-selenouridine synthase
MTKSRSNTEDFLNLFLNDIPMMDVRAAIEVNKGAFPMSVNHPLLDDEQRHEIGIRYKEAGEQEAIVLGLQLFTPAIKAERLALWQTFCESNPDGYLFCFRGGLRSRTTQGWLSDAGIDYPLVTGGYKAMRRFLIDELDSSIKSLRMINICGPTGSGKTRVLQHINHMLDFEGLAHHRGSAFGRNMHDLQPTNIDWENAVSVAMLKHRYRQVGKPLFVEDEGRMIGRVVMADNLANAMTGNELALVEEALERRVAMTVEDYITIPWQEYKAEFGEQAAQKFSDYWLDSLARIQKRLGGERYKILKALFEGALKDLFSDEDCNGFAEGIEVLLSDYYDPMYNYQFSKRQGKVIFKGSADDIIEWANSF